MAMNDWERERLREKTLAEMEEKALDVMQRERPSDAQIAHAANVILQIGIVRALQDLTRAVRKADD